MAPPRSHPAHRKRGTDRKCDCQNPIENGGFSEGCEEHTEMSAAERRTQEWLRELEDRK